MEKTKKNYFVKWTCVRFLDAKYFLKPWDRETFTINQKAYPILQIGCETSKFGLHVKNFTFLYHRHMIKKCEILDMEPKFGSFATNP